MEISSLDLDGKYKLIHVWGPWCVPCIRNYPRLLDISGNAEVQLMGVAVSDTRLEVLESREYQGSEWEHLFYTFDGIDEQQDIVVTAYPTYFLLNNDNKLLVKSSTLEDIQSLIR